MTATPPEPGENLLLTAARTATAGGADLSWDDPADLGRRSFEALVASTDEDRVLPSNGQLRLHGAAVAGNSVRIADLGGVLSSFQRTVTSVGGALEGHKTTRGTLPGTIVQRTHLRVEAAPLPGSVVLNISPEQAPDDELFGDVTLPLTTEQDDRPLADRSLEEVIRLLGDSTAPQGGSIRSELRRLGPRAASAIRAFLGIVADDDLDLDLSWREPHRPTVRTRLTAGQARYLESTIGGSELDVDETTVEGVVRTISDLRPMDVQDDEGAIWKLQLGDQPPGDLGRFTVGERVRALVRTSAQQRAGGDEVVTNTLLRIEHLPAGPASGS